MFLNCLLKDVAIGIIFKNKLWVFKKELVFKDFGQMTRKARGSIIQKQTVKRKWKIVKENK